MGKAESLIGAEFDGYRIVRLLGQGGMGAVYEALELALHRRVAIKMLAETVNRDLDAVRRFQREARAVASVSHPNVAQIYRVGAYGDLHYYTMEYVDGKSLDQMIMENRRIAGSRCFNFMAQAVKGLKAAADRGIIHRDIKPANLMVTSDGTVKIVDFGIAKMADDSETFRTATGMLMGTPSYMSPEQCKGQAVDFRSDMYSLGCTFFQALTGKPPFEGDTAFTLMSKHISALVPAIPSLAANVPERFCNIIYTMMEKNPDKRFQSYEHLLSVLEAAREGRAAGFTAMVVEEGAPPSDQLAADQRRKKRLYLAAALIAALVIALFAYTAHRRSQDDKTRDKAARKELHQDAPEGGLRGVGKDLREINKADREARKEAREAY
jgi:serine/threonine-protein kinase